MTRSRPQSSYVLVFLFFALSILTGVSQEQSQEDAEKKGSGGKPFSSPSGQRAARDYDDVDPTFQVKLEGSMTGGQVQIDEESKITTHVHSRLESLLRGTRTEECRQEIINAYRDYMGAMALERALPFEVDKFKTQCKDPNNRPPLPPTGLVKAEEVKLVYVILAHEDAAQVVRLVNALDDEPGRRETRTWFIIHIDLKAEDVQQELKLAFQGRPNVVMMQDDRRQDVAWGGFNVVQATLEAIRVALDSEIPFNWLWILSGTTYPIASNDDIRAKLASHHPESIFMESKASPHKPVSTAWHYFVECDSALHRIGRNLTPRDMEMYVGSQWLAMPPAAARWLMDDKALVPKYWRYAKHIVVADENFLPTVFRNSPFCAHHVTSNLVHVQFDRYEHTLDREDRRADKCLMPNPDHCGRSPALMNVDYLSVLEHSGMLFARKFDPKDTEVLDVLDRVRGGEVSRWRKGESFNFISIRSAAAVEVAKPRDGPGGRRGLDPGDAKELCLALDEPPPKTGREPGASAGARMVPCSEEDSRQIFKLGPCSSDGTLSLGDGGRGYMKSSRGEITGRSPSCSLRTLKSNCLDLLGEAKQAGAAAISFRYQDDPVGCLPVHHGCHNRWNQFFSFGEGELEGHVLMNVPRHLAMADGVKDGQLCLEVLRNVEGDLILMTAECAPENRAQKFSFVQLRLKTLPADVEPAHNSGKRQFLASSHGQCAAGDESCTAK